MPDSCNHGEKMSVCNMVITKNMQTLFFISGGVWLFFRENVFGIPFELIGINVPSVPDEVLEELVVVFILHNDAGGLDDIFNILNKFATVRTKLVLVDRGMVEDIFQRVVDLGVVGQPPVTEGLDNAIKS